VTVPDVKMQAPAINIYDPRAIEVLTKLARHKESSQVVAGLFAARSKRERKRIRALYETIRGRIQDCPQNDVDQRRVTSPDWFTKNPQRMLDAGMVCQLYRSTREAMINRGAKVDDPIESISLYVDTYEAFLRTKGQEATDAELQLHRAVVIIKLWQAGRFVFRRCAECRNEYLLFTEQRSSPICPSCALEIRICCSECGTTIRNKTKPGPLFKELCVTCKQKNSSAATAGITTVGDRPG